MEAFFLLMIFISGFSEGIMDLLQFHFYSSKFKKYNNDFWNPLISWKNKWKDGNPLNGPKFTGSSSFFVFLTDGWHLFKMIRNILIFIGLLGLGFVIHNFYYLIFFFILSRLIYGAGFWMSYNYIFKG